MLLTPKLTPICFLSLLLLATVSCSSNPNQTSVKPNLEATSPTSSPNSEVAPTQPLSPPASSSETIATSQTTPPQPSPVASTSSESSQPTESSDPGVLVQDFCAQKGQKVEQYFETNNFQIYLCYDQGNQTFYYGVDKRNGAAIALPTYTEEGTGYVATNGDYEYIVTGASLSVYEKGKLILEENVIRSL
jgi:hypothetical protein